MRDCCPTVWLHPRSRLEDGEVIGRSELKLVSFSMFSFCALQSRITYADSLVDIPSQSSLNLPGDNIDPHLSDMQPLTDDHYKTRIPSLANPPNPYELFGPKIEPDSPQLSEIDNIPWFGHNRGNHSSSSYKYNPLVSTELPRAPILKSENLPFSGSYLNLAEEKKVDEVSRLKGVQWPGMDCFDAASEVMKRQRNQKKDASLFKAMEEASCASEPSELVFSPSGTLRREREITGFVEEEDDLLPGEWTVPKYRRDRRDRRNRGTQELSTARRRQGSQRVALAVTDANRPVLGSRVVKREHQPKRSILGDNKRRESSIRASSSKNNDHGLFHGHFHRAHDENEDLQLSMGTTGRRRTSRLNIFRDDDTEVEEKPNSPSPEMVPSSTNRNEQHNALYQRASDAIHSLLETNDSYKLPTLSNDTSPILERSDSHNRTSAPPNTSRNIDGIYLVDTSLGPNHRVPYDPLVGGNVLHYRWDWHGSELGRSNDADDNLLGGGLFYNRAVSSDTIYQDEHETKSCLWLDGYSR